MRTAIAVLITALSVASCGGSGDDAPDPAAAGASTAPSASSAPRPTSTPTASVDLAAAVLQLADLPTGWSRSADEEDDGGIEYASSSKECGVRWTQANAPMDLEAEATFERGGSAQLQQTVSENPRNTIAEARKLAEECPSYTATVDGTAAKITLSELSFPAIGPESVAYAAKFEIDGQQLEGYLSLVRQGDFGISTTLLEAFAPDADLLESVVRKTAGRLPGAVPASASTGSTGTDSTPE